MSVQKFMEATRPLDAMSGKPAILKMKAAGATILYMLLEDGGLVLQSKQNI